MILYAQKGATPVEETPLPGTLACGDAYMLHKYYTIGPSVWAIANRHRLLE